MALVVLIFIWSLHNYTNPAKARFQDETILLHLLVMLALTFPSGWTLNFILALVTLPLELKLYGIYALIYFSLTCAIAGILQWFVFLPWCWSKWKNRKKAARV